MSIVGPRPLPTYYGPYYLPEERKRHQVRGGLIPPDGLSKQTTPEWETQFKYDNYYVDNVSFLLDCKVILQAYALSNYIDSLYPCEIINYYPDYAKSSYSLKTKIRSPQSLIEVTKEQHNERNIK